MRMMIKTILKAVWILVAFGVGLGVAGWWWFGPTGNQTETISFVIPEKTESFDAAKELKDRGLIKHAEVYRYFGKNKLKPGGYYLRKNMWLWEVITKLNGKPDMAWVTFSACLRKEQIGEILAEVLNWSPEGLKKWGKTEEGQYYPDTYLIPVKESIEDVEKRLVNRFNEKFAPLAEKYIQANIKWTTGLKIASLIAREAAGAEDMRLISGIIWNRLDKGMLLQIDATMQYTYGKRENGSWWGSISLAEKTRGSPYNTYLYKGLPPTPICSPNISYMEAALEPEKTDCLFYLHDKDKKVHCAKTYSEHLKNIKKYL